MCAFSNFSNPFQSELPSNGRHLWQNKHPDRLRHEIFAMRERFNDSFRLTMGDDGSLAWDGFLTTNRGNTYRVGLIYPNEFPYEVLSAYVLSPRFPSQHMDREGKLCLMMRDDNVWQTITTAVAIVALTAAWLFAYETHEERCRDGSYGAPCRIGSCPYWPGKKF